MEKMSTDEIMNVFVKSTPRRKQAEGGLSYLMGCVMTEIAKYNDMMSYLTRPGYLGDVTQVAI